MTTSRPSGIYLPLSTVSPRARSFIPNELPPEHLDLAWDLQDLWEKANRALGRLDGISVLLPETSIFIYMYVRKEAVLSSQIEGTQSSLSDLLLFELEDKPGVPLDDVREVSNYVAALEHGLKRIREDDFPLSTRLLCEMHRVLMRSGRGSRNQAGEVRTSQNWIGGRGPESAAFVPPPHTEVPRLLSNLERYLHDELGRVPTLIKAGIAHAQFETIHPFLDGNGRLGRLLITLLLCSEGALADPTLYLSLYFKAHRAEYYALLQRVRSEGAWADWLTFFLNGVYDTGQRAFSTARRLIELFESDRDRLAKTGRAAGSVLQVHEYLQRRPLLSVPKAAAHLPLSQPTIQKAIASMADLGMLREVTGKARYRVWAYDAYMDILNEGTELPS